MYKEKELAETVNGLKIGQLEKKILALEKAVHKLKFPRGDFGPSFVVINEAKPIDGQIENITSILQLAPDKALIFINGEK